MVIPKMFIYDFLLKFPYTKKRLMQLICLALLCMKYTFIYDWMLCPKSNYLRNVSSANNLLYNFAFLYDSINILLSLLPQLICIEPSKQPDDIHILILFLWSYCYFHIYINIWNWSDSNDSMKKHYLKFFCRLKITISADFAQRKSKNMTLWCAST